MPLPDVPRGDDDVVRRLGVVELLVQQASAIAGNAKALAAAIQTGLANIASSGQTWQGPVNTSGTVQAGTFNGGSSTAGTMGVGTANIGTSNVTGNETVQGTVSGVAGLTSLGAYSLDVSTLPGGRQTVWQHNSGRYGFAPSTRASKTSLKALPFTAQDARAVQGWLFQYRNQLAIRDDPENDYYDPDYRVPWDVGLMAEDLIAHNMSCFVVFEEDGVTPKTVNYDLFGAIVPLVLDADTQDQIRKLRQLLPQVKV